tara:strand:- start:566 stop:1729 length:1164 start_codon:yes stop_codon:yes gene_type:complete
MKRKIAVVISARASYAKFKSLLRHLQRDKKCDLKVIAAASMNSLKYGLASDIVEKDGFEIDYRVESLTENDSLFGSAKTASATLNDCAIIFSKEKPDIVVVMGDRYEVLPISIASSYQNITLAHIQGGEVTGNIDEKVRHAITKLADYHFVSNELARENVYQMGEDKETIFNVGCPSIDIAKEILERGNIELNKLVTGVGKDLDFNSEFNVVMFHPETEFLQDIPSNIKHLTHIISDSDLPTVWFWPNSDPGNEIITKEIRANREAGLLKNCLFVKTLNPSTFLYLLSRANCLIGNSSAGIRESNFLGLPVINIGRRQEGRERGENVIDWNFDREESLLELISKFPKNDFSSGNVYGVGDAGKQISKILMEVELISLKRFQKRPLAE